MKNKNSLLITFLSTVFVLCLVPGFLVSTYDINNPIPLSIFIVAVSIILHFKKNLISIVLITTSLLIVHYTYFANELPFFDWLSTLTTQFIFSIEYIFSGQAMFIPTFIGFFVIELLIVVILLILIWYRSWKLPFIVAIVYISTLIVLGYTGLEIPLIILLISTSLIALSIQFNDVTTLKKTGRKQATLSLIIVVILLVSFTSNPIRNSLTSVIKQQTNTVRHSWQTSFFNLLNNIGDSTGIKLGTGFSENDDNLGGPINNVYTPVFSALVSESNYWRIESKEVYTGKGWTTNSVLDQELVSNVRIPGTFTKYEDDVRTITFTTSRKGLTFLPLPYGDVEISFNTDFLSNNIEYSSDNQRIRVDSLNDNELINVTYKYRKPLYSVEELNNSSAKAQNSDSIYTQLPDNLPIRISNHAKKLTANSKTDYERVRAIVDHLSKSYDTYTYSLDKAQYVPAGDDYVDHFLFTSQIGYCEHFSSAAVVLLRSLNIQSRWVKGYAPGTMTNTPEGRISNVNESYAHAWIEVYFDGVGWVPFETTPSFSIDVAPQVTPNQPTTPSTPQTPTTPITPVPTEPTNPVTPTDPTNPTTPTNPNNNNPDNTNNSSLFSNPIIRLVLVSVSSILIIGLFIMSYVYRKQLYKKYLIILLKSKKNIQFTDMYLKVLKAIEYKYPRNKATTLLEYTNLLKNNKETFYKDFGILTHQFYKTSYSTESNLEFSTTTKNQFINILTNLSYK